MTWLDWALIGVLVIFVGAGAKVGSLWTSACIAGGFVGFYLADTYAPAIGSLLGRFWGASFVAGVGLYLAGVSGLLVIGWVLGKVVGGLFLGFFDGLFGVVTGLVAGFFLVTLVLLILIPTFPRFESTPAWRGSVLVRPLERILENWFSAIRISKPSLSTVSRPLVRGVEKAADHVEDSIKATAHRAVSAVKKD